MLFVNCVSFVCSHLYFLRGLQVAALCAVANDSGSPLVQRNLLDFLCAAFPLDSTNLTSEDFVQLLMRCMFVVLRRDMSLNRRLYTWLMSPAGGNVAISSIPIGDDGVESTFFTDNALPLIVEALTEYLKLDLVEIPQVSTNAWAYGWGDKKVEFSSIFYIYHSCCFGYYDRK
ncbi:hypothetical protein ANCCAN_30168 [Ancylostoma caninum]|uniref:DOP1 N-terminal domain-containing protein n=1 Tax=Ancylostoma caninum TaxID=29170 RepID=A0A368EWL5_ANCCA|nr:hypothetical protein ANCCAN_30168 [Ancylostoma caninum]